MDTLLFLQAALAVNRRLAVCGSPSYKFTVHSSYIASFASGVIPLALMAIPTFEIWGKLDWEEESGEILIIDRLGIIWY